MIDEYIARHGKRLYGLCVTLSPAEADDLYQDTWLKAIERISQYDASREFEPWLTKICVNTYRNMLRRLTKRSVWDMALEDKDSFVNALPAPMPDDYSALREAINRLPEKLRITIILYYFCGLDIASAAQALAIPTGTVKSRLNKSRTLLKEMLMRESGLPF